jgi:hypothetical protein
MWFRVSGSCASAQLLAASVANNLDLKAMLLYLCEMAQRITLLLLIAW